MQESAFGLVVAVTDEESGGIVAGVECHAVGGVELFEVIAFLAEVFDVFAVAVIDKDVIAGVAIGEIDISVGSDGDGGGFEVLESESGFFGVGKFESDCAGFGVEFDTFAGIVAGTVDVFAVGFLADFDVVHAGVFVTEEAADDLAVGVEYKDADIGAGVDIALFVDDDATVS